MVRLEVRNAVVVSTKSAKIVTVPPEDIAALVDEMQLAEESAARLSLSACALAQWYFMPKALMQPPEDRPASRKRLAKIAKSAAALKAELADLGPLAAVTLTEVGQELAGEHDPRFSLMGLQRELAQLSQAANGARDNLPALKRGRHEDPVIELVVRQLVRVTEAATGEPIVASKTKNSAYDPHLEGRSGRFIMAWFKCVDRHVSLTTLYHQVMKAKEMLQQPGVAEEDAKWLELSELALLSMVSPTP